MICHLELAIWHLTCVFFKLPPKISQLGIFFKQMWYQVVEIMDETDGRPSVKNLSSQLTHCQLTLRVSEISFWGHLEVCNSHRELAVRSSWWAHHAVVAVSSLWAGLLWAHSVGSLWSHCLFLVKIFRMNSLWLWP